ncbi:hypothetical protein JJB99_12240 [Bradyrhizobium diazoefficiens]|uniref:DNA-directed RNA polymerase subunit alpha C-terminal domain-containing protein n=1 Tax=Bradyrhizobium diazoefficiens TaxID=1355477 RepID=UPI00190A9C67|nr:hypothetical protein JJB99_12240 [Bradyrhizobium diazoefficiens]
MMNDNSISKPASAAQLAAEKMFRQAEPEVSEYIKAQQAFGANRERLRDERLAREAVAPTHLAPTPELPDDTPLANVRLPSRVQNALQAAGFKTVGEVRDATDKTLVSLQDLGKKSVSELRDTLGLPSTEGVRPCR